jgi:hypothetical protein
MSAHGMIGSFKSDIRLSYSTSTPASNSALSDLRHFLHTGPLPSSTTSLFAPGSATFNTHPVIYKNRTKFD